MRVHTVSFSAFFSLLLCWGCGTHDSSTWVLEESEGLLIYDVEIETDTRIDVDKGQGAGVFLEYASGGEWELFTTCDTQVSDLLCEFDIVLSVPLGSQIESATRVELERGDHVVRQEGGVLQLLWLTGSDFDRVTFRTDPGETLRLDALIDGYPDPELIFWNGYGALQIAAPSNPLDLTPSKR